MDTAGRHLNPLQRVRGSCGTYTLFHTWCGFDKYKVMSFRLTSSLAIEPTYRGIIFHHPAVDTSGNHGKTMGWLRPLASAVAGTVEYSVATG